MNKKICLTLAILLSFFVFKKSILADSPANSVIINEIAWMGSLTSASDEWIELKNTSSTNIDLKNWQLISKDGSLKITLTGTIQAGGFFLLERTDDNSVPNVKADLIYSGTLGNTGENLELRDSSNNLIDSIVSGSAWPGGDKATKQTLERTDNLIWQTSALPLGTPKKENGNSTLVVISQNNSSSSSNSSSRRICYLGDVLISEFVADPSPNENEWIELHNSTPREININDWTITDGSGTVTKLAGAISLAKNNNFLVVENPKGKLNNTGDAIVLRDENNVLIDQVAFGNFDDGNIKDNAPTANKPNSVARQIDNYNTHNNSEDFKITATPTKGASNIISNAISTNEKTETPAPKNTVIITEIFPNPTGVDYDNEFIEIYNSSEKEINLKNWRLENQVGNIFVFSDLMIKPNDYYVIKRNKSGIILNNNSEIVKLFPADKEKASQTVIFKNAKESWSYNLDQKDNTRWSWEENPTPGKINQVKKINQAPLVDFYFPDTGKINEPIFFDSSDTDDLDSNNLKFLWDFGDGTKNSIASPEHTFLKPGNYNISLTVSDEENSIIKEKTIIISNGTNSILSSPENIQTNNLAKNIIINEFFPNPEKDETNNEWIEIYNQGESKINLLNWKIDDGDKGSPAYQFKKDFWLEGDSYAVISRKDSKIALNNNADSIRIFDDKNNLIDSVEYKNAPVDETYARGLNNKWFWTKQLTPGQENNISLVSTNYNQNNGSTFYSSLPNTEKINLIQNLNGITPLEQIKNLKIGEKIIAEGIVTALPGTLGSQFFYIASSSGIQIYNNKKDFPEFNLGDLIQVAGELSQINNEWRLKTDSMEAIKVVRQNNEIPKTELACGEVNEDFLSQLIEVAGEITSKKGSTLYLDDGTGELLVYIKTSSNIDLKNFKEGDYATVDGILSNTRTGLRLLPRTDEDIIIKQNAQTDNGQVLGTSTSNDKWQLTSDDKNQKLIEYLVIIISAGLIISIVWFMKKNI